MDAAALRLQSLDTGIERCLVQIAPVLNGGTPDGSEWHERPAVFSAATIAELQGLLRFRHLVRHLDGYELRPQPAEELRNRMIRLWPDVLGELQRFRAWLLEAAEALP